MQCNSRARLTQTGMHGDIPGLVAHIGMQAVAAQDTFLRQTERLEQRAEA
jgi:hypothetical protein